MNMETVGMNIHILTGLGQDDSHVNIMGAEIIASGVDLVPSRIAIGMGDRDMPVTFNFWISHTYSQIAPLIPGANIVLAELMPVGFGLKFDHFRAPRSYSAAEGNSVCGSTVSFPVLCADVAATGTGAAHGCLTSAKPSTSISARGSPWVQSFTACISTTQQSSCHATWLSPSLIDLRQLSRSGRCV